MDVIAGNIANANTPGYKAERTQFSDWLSRQSTPPERTIAFTQDRATWREQQSGTLTHTGNPLDLALTSNGYFTVSTPRGPRLTRDGRFGLLPSGTVADSAGDALLDFEWSAGSAFDHRHNHHGCRRRHAFQSKWPACQDWRGSADQSHAASG